LALPTNTVWEVRSLGSDTNGGGFIAGGAGFDYSQQNAANSGASDKSTTDAVANGTTTLTSATANFTANVVDNIIYLAGGSGSLTAGWYRVISRTNSTTITLDRTVAAGTGITMNIGGALATIGKPLTIAAAIGGNKYFVKADGTYQISANIVAGAGSYDGFGGVSGKIIGYSSSRTDGGRPTVQLITNTGLTAFEFASGGGAGWQLWNFNIDCNSLGTSTGVKICSYGFVYNVKVSNYTLAGIDVRSTTYPSVIDCEATGGTSAATGGICSDGASSIQRTWSHNNACTGFKLSTSAYCMCCIASNNTGASSDGFSFDYGNYFRDCISYQNGRDGLRGNGYGIGNSINACIMAKNTGYGLRDGSGQLPAVPWRDGNAYWSNTAGTRNGYDDAANGTNVVSPYVTAHDVILSADPFVNAASNDFALNSVTGGGAACRASRWPKTVANGAITSQDYGDMGAYQHLDAGSAAARLQGTLK
jgi:hypothetical protein